MKRRTGYVYRHGAGYSVKWVVNGKRFVQALRDAAGDPIKNKREAEAEAARIVSPYAAASLADALRHTVAKLTTATAEVDRLEDEARPGLSIASAWQAYLAAANRPDSGEATLEQYAFQWERFAGWMKTTYPDTTALRQVTEEMAQAYAANLSGTVGPSTFNRHTGLLRLVFRVLAKPAGVLKNPFAEVMNKTAPGGHGRRELTIEELQRVCLNATGELRTLLALGLFTGLRLGDCATLQWGEVDLLRGIIVRIPNKTARHNHKPVTIPIHKDLAAVLGETPKTARRGGVLPDLGGRYREKRDQVTDRVQKHLIACGITCHATGTGPGTDKRAVVEVGFHSLRHSFVSLCREAGAPLSVVESIVGHSSPAMTRHYTHTGEAAARKAIGALPGLGGRKVKRTPATRVARLVAKVEEMSPEQVKRGVLRLLKALAVKEVAE